MNTAKQMNTELDEDITKHVLETISSDSIQTWELSGLGSVDILIHTSYVNILKAQISINKMFIREGQFLSIADVLAVFDESLIFDHGAQMDVYHSGWNWVCYEGLDFPWIDFKITHYYTESGELIFKIQFVDQAQMPKPPCDGAYDCGPEQYYTDCEQYY